MLQLIEVSIEDAKVLCQSEIIHWRPEGNIPGDGAYLQGHMLPYEEIPVAEENRAVVVKILSDPEEDTKNEKL